MASYIPDFLDWTPAELEKRLDAEIERARRPDVEVHDHGSIVLVVPLSEAASEWVAEHIPDDVMWWAGGFVCEPRYAEDIVRGMTDDGLKVG